MYFVPDLVKFQIQMKNLNVTMLYIIKERSSWFQQAREFVLEFSKH